MWCAGCKSDVVVEVPHGTQRARCATCGRELTTSLSGMDIATDTPRASDSTASATKQPKASGATPSKIPAPQTIADARQLLERWTRENLLDPTESKSTASPSSRDAKSESPSAITKLVGTQRKNVASPSDADRPVEKSPENITRVVNETTKRNIAQQSPDVPKVSPGPPKFRIDRTHASADQPTSDAPSTSANQPIATTESKTESSKNASITGQGTIDQVPSTTTRRVHAAHPPLAGVHFDVQSLIQSDQESPRQTTQTIFGQMLAYLGVGVLTLGTGCVLWGYFGAAQYAHLAPTGWLITTAGQMLLFLGVVTLIAGGLEQTNSLVNTRLEHWERKWMEINGHIFRADPPTSQPMGQGPHLPVQSFESPGSASRAETRTTVGLDRDD